MNTLPRDPPPTMLLSREELVELTGYRQTTRQLRWIAERLRITAPRRADGLPIVSRAQVEAALQPRETPPLKSGPQWSR